MGRIPTSGSPSPRRGMRAGLAGLLGAGLIAGMVALVPAAAAATATPPTPSDPTSRAQAEAKASGHGVVVDALTDEYSTTTANPDGSLTLSRYVDAQRVKQNGSWVPIDATLKADADGSISPKATLNGLTISGGGAGALATLTNGKAALAFTWPTALPAPNLSGSTALYKNVLPGVDLQLAADRWGGVEDTLIVRDATAAANPALRHIHLASKLTGANLSTDSAGDTTATTPDGRIAFSSGDARMWDSATGTSGAALVRSAAPASAAGSVPAPSPSISTSTAAGPGVGAHVAKISSTLTAAGANLTPDAATLTGPNIVYPVYIDPQWAQSPTTAQHFNQLTQADPTNVNTFDRAQPSGEGIGYQGNYYGGATGGGSYASGDQCPCGVDRTDLQIAIPSAIFGATILSATFQAGARFESDPYVHTTPVSLYSVGPLSPGQTWNSPPARDSQANPNYPGPVATTSFSTPANNNYPGQAFNLNVTTAMQQVANRSWGTWTIELTGDESNAYNFFRIDQTAVYFSIQYDRPAWLDTFTTSPAPMNAGTNGVCPSTGNVDGGWLGAATGGSVTTSVKVHSSTTSSTSQLGANFWLHDDTANSYVWNKLPSAGTFNDGDTITESAGGLADGHAYSWSADAYDHYIESGGQGPCHFSTDFTPPTSPAVGSPQYPSSDSGWARTAAGVAGTFNLSATDPGTNPSGVWCFQYAFDGTLSTAAASNTCNQSDPQTVMAANGAAGVTWTPPSWGTHTLQVRSVDRAGNTSSPATYSFYALNAPNAKPSPGALTGDGVPGLVTTDGSGDLVLYQAKLGVGADQAGSLAGGTVLLRPADSPNGDSWANYHVTHRGSMSGKYVDDLLVQKPGSTTLWIYLNDGAGHFSRAGMKQILNQGANLSAALQIVAIGDGDGRTVNGFGNFSDYLAVTPDGTGINQLWLFKYVNNSRFATPVQISAYTATNNLLANVTSKNPSLYSPGTNSTDGTAYLWYEDATGQIWQQSGLKNSVNAIDWNNGIGGQDQTNHAAVKVGAPLPSSTYTLVTSTGSVTGSVTPDLWGVTTSGTVVLLPGASNGFGTALNQASTGSTTGPVMSWMLGNGPMAAGYNSLDVNTASTDTTGRHYITGEYDASGNGANGTGSGGVWETGSHDGGAASFDGSTGVLTSSGPVIDTTKSFTMSGWVNLNDEVKHYAVVARNGVNAPSAWLGYDPVLNTWAFEMPSNDSTAPAYPGALAPAGSAVAGTWTHLAAVYTATAATSGNLALYVNGVLAGTGSTTTAWNNSSTTLTVGGRTASDYLNGAADDITVYDHAIGAGEVTSLYTAGKSRIPTGYSIALSGVTAGSTVSGAVTLGATTSQTGVAKYLSYIVSGPSYTEVFGGAETAAAGGTGGQFAGVSLATATLADGSYTIKPRATMQNGGTQDFPAVSFTISNNPGHSALIKRSDSPEISVYTGNARIVYTDWNDLVAGYGSSPNIITVTDAWYNALPTTPTPGTLVKSAGSPDIGVYAGGADLKFSNWNDLVAGYGTAPAYTTVPTYFWNSLTAAPADGTLIKKAGSVQIWKYEAATNTKFAESMDDLIATYGTAVPPISVAPTGYVDGLTVSTT